MFSAQMLTESNHKFIEIFSYLNRNWFSVNFLESADVGSVNHCFRELGLQEAMCLQKEGDATSTYERINSLQGEIENYK
jgi:hypothetical protein